MKKLLSFLAAGALALGLIGCSGDLHDLKASPLGVVGFDSGSTNKVVLMNMDADDGSEQSLAFTWGSSSTVTAADGTLFNVQDGWGKASGVQFKIILPEGVKSDGTPDWSKDLSYSDKMTYITPGDDTYIALNPRGVNGYSGAEGQNITISGLADGQEYILKALYDSAAGKVQVRVEGVVANPEACRVKFFTSRTLKVDDKNTPIKPNVYEYKNDNENTNFPLEDKDGKEIVRTMTKSGNIYTYRFIATKDEPPIKFVVSNDVIGDINKVYELNGIKKNFEYQITVAKNTNSVSYTYSVINMARMPYLLSAEVITNSQHSYDSYPEYSVVKLCTDSWKYGDDDTGSNDYQSDPYWGGGYWSQGGWWANDCNILFFKGLDQESFEMTINRAADNDKMVWGKDTNNIVVDGSEEVKLKYVDNRNIDDDKSFEPESITPVKISGIKKDKNYQMVFTQGTDDFALKAKVETLDSEEKLSDETDILIIGGIAKSESAAAKVTVPTDGFKVPVTDSKFEFTFTYTGNDSWGAGAGEHAFTIMTSDAGSNWSCRARWGGASKMSDGIVGAYTAIGGSNNIVLTGMTANKKYKLTGTVYKDFIDMKLEEVQ